MNEKEKVKLLLKFIENLKDSVGVFEFCKALVETEITQEDQQSILDIIQENKQGDLN